MVTYLTNYVSTDILAESFTDLSDGTVTSSSSTAFILQNNGNDTRISFKGTGLGDFDANGIPHTGVITQISLTSADGNTDLALLKHCHIAVDDLLSYFENNDMAGLQSEIFAGQTILTGSTGDDSFYGGSGNDTFYLSQGGNDTAVGGTGSDEFDMGASFTSSDRIDGGTGDDTIRLTPLNGSATVITSDMMQSVEELLIDSQSNALPAYAFTLDNGAAGSHLNVVIDGCAVDFDASAETSASVDVNIVYSSGVVRTGSGNDIINSYTSESVAPPHVVTIYCGAGDDVVDAPFGIGSGGGQNNEIVHGGDGLDTIYGGARHDVLYGDGGTDHLYGGTGDDLLYAGHGKHEVLSGDNGDDTISFSGGRLDHVDSVNGGSGTDTVVLDSDYSGPLALHMTKDTMRKVEILRVTDGNSYDIRSSNASLAPEKTLTVDGSGLSALYTLTFDGSRELNGHYNIIGGLGGDTLTGGQVSDTFVYTSAAQSSSTAYDTINAFQFGTDKINVTGHITSIADAASHTLSTDTFDTDLSDATGALVAQSAMLVTGAGGTLDGQVFLVVDQNGTTGYQSGEDLVIHLNAATGTLTTGDFI